MGVETSSNRLASTNSHAATSINAVGKPEEPDVRAGDKWPMTFAKMLGDWGYKSTYFFLLIILAIFLTLEVLRRRRARKRMTKDQ